MRKLNQRQLKWVVREMHKGELSVWQVARQQGITQQWARELKRRFESAGQARLKACGRKRVPLCAQIEQLVLEEKARTLLGAVNLEKVLKQKGVRLSHNKIQDVLDAHGLAKKEPKKSKRRKWVRWERKRSNSLWHADWTFKFGKNVLVVEDDASRFIVGYGEFEHANAENTRRVFAQAFAVYGLPKQVLTDHGSQFVNVHDSKGGHEFADWLRSLDVKPIYARVKHPQTNGKVERLFQTLVKGWKAFGSLKKAVEWYNDVRPHMSLELSTGRLRTPAQAYKEKRGKNK